MRIIDNQYDYYDYLQSYTDPIVFDRRGSRVITKEQVCNEIKILDNHDTGKRLLLLQCGATYWLILLSITEWGSGWWNDKEPKNYELKLLDKWQNHSSERKITSLDLVHVPLSLSKIHPSIYSSSVKEDAVIENVDKIKNAILTKDYNPRNIFNEYVREWDNFIHKHITKYKPPLLKACGISSIIDPLDIFLAIEEHFSLLKTEAERTEPLGATNEDKIVMHGFDMKTSFRG